MANLIIATQIPNQINTFEKLAMWATLYLGTYVGSKSWNPQPLGEQTPINTSGVYTDINGKRWYVIGLAIPLAAGYAFDTSVKPWQWAENIVTQDTISDGKWTAN